MDLYIDSTTRGRFRVGLEGKQGDKTFNFRPFIIDANNETGNFYLKVDDVDGNQKYTDGTYVTCTRGQWHNVTVVINKTTAECKVYFNGVYKFTTQNNGDATSNYFKYVPTGAFDISANSLYLQNIGKNSNSYYAGFAQFDNISLRTLNEDPDALWQEGFEMPGTAASFFQSGYDATYLKLANDAVNTGNKVIQLDYNASTSTGMGNMLMNPAWKNSDVEQYVFQLDVYISNDARGKLVLAAKGNLTERDPNRTENRDDFGIQMFAIESLADRTVLTRHENQTYLHGTAGVTYETGKWNTVTVAINKNNGEYDVYLNGSFVFTHQNNGNSDGYWHYIPAGPFDLVENYLYLQFNKSGNTTPSGYAQIDNIALYPSLEAALGEEHFYFDSTKYADMLTTESTNQIRLSSNEDGSGIRYATKVDKALLDQLQALVESGDIAALEFGTMIAPAAYIGYGKTEGSFTMQEEFTVSALESNANLTVENKYLLVKANYGYYYGGFDTDDSTTHFAGSIVKILEHNYSLDFIGRGYVKVTLQDGRNIYIYSETMNQTSVQEKATAVLKMITDGDLPAYEEAEMAILEKYKAGSPVAES